MKKFFVLLIVLAVASSALFFVPTGQAIAEEEESAYLLVDRENVSLYKNTLKMEPLFILQRTFYVKILEANYAENYHLVEYNGVVGLVKASEVSGSQRTDVKDPYYTAKTISPHINGHLYKRPSFKESEDTGIVAYGLSLTYLGKITGERGTYGSQTWFAVLYSENVYYIHAAMTENLDLLESSFAPVHPNSVSESTGTQTSSEGESDASANGGKKVNVVRILLVIGMFVPITVILFVLFRPRKKRAHALKGKSEDDDD